MEYPLDLKLPAPAVGFAVANDEAEHIALTEAGYQPAFVAPVAPVEPVAPVAPAPTGKKAAAKEPAPE